MIRKFDSENFKRGGVSSTLVEKMDEMGILGNMPEDNQLSLFDDLF